MQPGHLSQGLLFTTNVTVDDLNWNSANCQALPPRQTKKLVFLSLCMHHNTRSGQEDAGKHLQGFKPVQKMGEQCQSMYEAHLAGPAPCTLYNDILTTGLPVTGETRKQAPGQTEVQNCVDTQYRYQDPHDMAHPDCVFVIIHDLTTNKQ